MLQINIVKGSVKVQRNFDIGINGRKQFLETTALGTHLDKKKHLTRYILVKILLFSLQFKIVILLGCD